MFNLFMIALLSLSLATSYDYNTTSMSDIEIYTTGLQETTNYLEVNTSEILETSQATFNTSAEYTTFNSINELTSQTGFTISTNESNFINTYETEVTSTESYETSLANKLSTENTFESILNDITTQVMKTSAEADTTSTTVSSNEESVQNTIVRDSKTIAYTLASYVIISSTRKISSSTTNQLSSLTNEAMSTTGSMITTNEISSSTTNLKTSVISTAENINLTTIVNQTTSATTFYNNSTNQLITNVNQASALTTITSTPYTPTAVNTSTPTSSTTTLYTPLTSNTTIAPKQTLYTTLLTTISSAATISTFYTSALNINSSISLHNFPEATSPLKINISSPTTPKAYTSTLISSKPTIYTTLATNKSPTTIKYPPTTSSMSTTTTAAPFISKTSSKNKTKTTKPLNKTTFDIPTESMTEFTNEMSTQMATDYPYSAVQDTTAISNTNSSPNTPTTPKASASQTGFITSTTESNLIGTYYTHETEVTSTETTLVSTESYETSSADLTKLSTENSIESFLNDITTQVSDQTYSDLTTLAEIETMSTTVSSNEENTKNSILKDLTDCFESTLTNDMIASTDNSDIDSTPHYFDKITQFYNIGTNSDLTTLIETEGMSTVGSWNEKSTQNSVLKNSKTIVSTLATNVVTSSTIPMTSLLKTKSFTTAIFPLTSSKSSLGTSFDIYPFLTSLYTINTSTGLISSIPTISTLLKTIISTPNTVKPTTPKTTIYTLLTSAIINSSPTTNRIGTTLSTKRYSDNHTKHTTTSFKITKINNITMGITQIDSTKTLLTSNKALSTTKLITDTKISTTSYSMDLTETNIASINTTSVRGILLTASLINKSIYIPNNSTSFISKTTTKLDSSLKTTITTDKAITSSINSSITRIFTNEPASTNSITSASIIIKTDTINPFSTSRSPASTMIYSLNTSRSNFDSSTSTPYKFPTILYKNISLIPNTTTAWPISLTKNIKTTLRFRAPTPSTPIATKPTLVLLTTTSLLSKITSVTTSIPPQQMFTGELTQKQTSVNYITEMENKMMTSISRAMTKEISTTIAYTDYEEANYTNINCSNSLFNNHLNIKLILLVLNIIFRAIFN